LYSRFLASLLARHKRDGAAQGRMPQQGPPTEQMASGSNAPVYQQPLQQPQPSHGTSSTGFSTGVSGASASDLTPMTLDNRVAVPNEGITTNSDSPGNYAFDVPPDFTFGVTSHQADMMDFTFDPIVAPGNEDMPAAMQAIQSPTWLENMLMPGSVDGCLYAVFIKLIVRDYRWSWPAEESIQDYNGSPGSGMALNNNHQNFQVQPTEALRGAHLVHT